MKKRKKNNGYLIGIIIIVYIYMSYCGKFQSELYNMGYNENVFITASLNALINISVNTVCIGFVPLIIFLNNKKFYKDRCKIIYIVNGISWIVISKPLYSYISNSNNNGIGLIGSIVFSIAVYNLIRGKDSHNSYKKNSDSKEKDENAIFKCSECGSICFLDDKMCRNCKALFDEDENNKAENNLEIFKCENCGAFVPDDADECPNCGELFEFDIDANNEVEKLYLKAIKNKEKGNIEEAKEELTKYISLTEEKIKLNKTKCYTFGNCIEFSIAVDQKEVEDKCIDINYNTSDAYLNLAIIAFDEENNDKAINLLGKSLKLNPCNISSMFEMAENYKVKGEIKKFLNWTKKCYEKIYYVNHLARYYRNLGYYYSETEKWDLAKTVYLYSLKYDNNPIVTTQLNYIISKSGDKALPMKEELTTILRKNGIPTFIKKDNLNIIKNLYEKLKKEKQLDSNVGIFITKIIKENSNS